MDPIALLSEYAEAKNRHDVEEMLARTHPECRYEDVGAGRVVTGRVELRGYHEHLFAAVPDYTADLEGITGSGNTAVAWGRFRGTLAQPLFGRGLPGDQLQTQAAFVCEFRDGLLYRERAHVDLLSLRKQLRPPAERFLRAFTTAWSRPTGAQLSALFTEDATVHRPGTHEPLRGRDAIRAYFDRLLAGQIDIELRPMTTATAPDTVFVHWQMQSTTADTPTLREGLDLFRLRGDLAEHAVTHLDPAITQPMEAAS